MSELVFYPLHWILNQSIDQLYIKGFIYDQSTKKSNHLHREQIIVQMDYHPTLWFKEVSSVDKLMNHPSVCDVYKMELDKQIVYKVCFDNYLDMCDAHDHLCMENELCNFGFDQLNNQLYLLPYNCTVQLNGWLKAICINTVHCDPEDQVIRVKCKKIRQAKDKVDGWSMLKIGCDVSDDILLYDDNSDVSLGDSVAWCIQDIMRLLVPHVRSDDYLTYFGMTSYQSDQIMTWWDKHKQIIFEYLEWMNCPVYYAFTEHEKYFCVSNFGITQATPHSIFYPAKDGLYENVHCYYINDVILSSGKVKTVVDVNINKVFQSVHCPENGKKIANILKKCPDLIMIREGFVFSAQPIKGLDDRMKLDKLICHQNDISFLDRGCVCNMGYGSLSCPDYPLIEKVKCHVLTGCELKIEPQDFQGKLRNSQISKNNYYHSNANATDYRLLDHSRINANQVDISYVMGETCIKICGEDTVPYYPFYEQMLDKIFSSKISSNIKLL